MLLRTQVHRTPSEHPIHPYEVGEGLLRPLPPVATPSAVAVGPLVDTEELLHATDTLLEAPTIDPVEQGRRHGDSSFAPPEPDPRPSTHVGPFF